MVEATVLLFKDVFKIDIEDTIPNYTMTITLVPSKVVNQEILDKRFEQWAIEGRKKQEIQMACAALNQHMRDVYKYGVEPKFLSEVLDHLDKLNIITNRTAYIYKGAAFPIVIKDEKNTLIIAPRVED